MTPTLYFSEVIKPLCSEFLQQPDKIHRLHAAVTATYHIVDYLREDANLPDGRNFDADGKIRGILYNHIPQFIHLYYVATAHKHAVVRRVSGAIGLRQGDINPPKFSPFLIFGKYLSYKGKIIGVTRGFHVELKGRTIELGKSLGAVVLYFEAHLDEVQTEVRLLKPKDSGG